MTNKVYCTNCRFFIQGLYQCSPDHPLSCDCPEVAREITTEHPVWGIRTHTDYGKCVELNKDFGCKYYKSKGKPV
jgi:hypothetical protein